MSLDTARIHAALEDTIFAGKVHHFPIIDSTQNLAIADAQAGAEAGQVYIADEQTAGRGRGGHTWHSEPDRGLYMTVLVRPHLSGNQVLRLSLATGIAAAQAIHTVTGNHIDIRWPNDLVIRGHRGPSLKAGGILAEASLSPDGPIHYAAIGIGINLNQTALPPDLEATATSLRKAWGQPVNREQLAIALLQELDTELRRFHPHNDGLTQAETLFQRFELASTWVHGKHVHVAEDEGYTGITAGLTADGLLRVTCNDGTLRIVRHGGVREL